MIVDKIENLARYVALNPLFADVVAFLQHHDLRTLPNGSHPIHGDRLYVNVEDTSGSVGRRLPWSIIAGWWISSCRSTSPRPTASSP